MDNNFSKNLKTLRIQANLSQKDLAERLNVSYKSISHWESGYAEPSIEILKELKDVFEVSYDDLLE